HCHKKSRAYLNPWVAGYRQKKGWADTAKDRSADELSHWTRSTLSYAKDFSEGKIAPVWVADGKGGLEHVCGFGQDFVWFKYPLQGNFSVEWETPGNNNNFADVAYNDLRITPRADSQFWYLTAGSSNRYGYMRSKVVSEEWNRCKYVVDDEHFSIFLNDTLVYQEPRSSEAAWFGVHAYGSRTSRIRGLAFEGSPEIPNQLDLIPTKGLRGWTAGYFGGATPSPGFSTEHREKEANKPTFYRDEIDRESVDQLSWTVNEERELVSGRQKNYGHQNQNVIQYQRPICDGDTLSYEFFYEEGKTEVSPSIGRVAYVLRPAGLQLHWMNAGSTSWKIPAAYEVPVPGVEPKPLPLKSGEWNQMELVRDGDTLKMKLNGETIFQQQPRSRLGDMVFGLFHYRDQSSARVRNIVLTGNWPEQLPEDLFDFDSEE
ncbi:MAG: DUF1583 domain-containing protein, partial [Planctomycetota bacterium]